MAAIIPLAAALAPAAPLALAALLGRYLLTLGAIRTALPAWAGRLVVAAPGVLLAPGRPIPARRGLSALLHNAASLALATAAAAALMGAGGDGAAGGALVAPLTAGGALAGAALTARAGVAGLGLAVVLAAPVWAVWLGAGAWLVAGQGVAGLLLGRRRWLPWLRAARAAWVRRR